MAGASVVAGLILVPITQRFSFIALARTWILIGTQSIGGGASTLVLMRRAMVDQLHWLSDREFLEDYALSKMSVGPGLIALTALLGTRMGGVRGAVTSLAALLVPSGAISLVLTVGYVSVRDDAFVRAALAGAGPITLGMTVGVTLTIIARAARRGWRGAVDWVYAGVALAAGLFVGLTPVIVIAAGIVIGLTLLRGEPRRDSSN